MNSNEQSDTGLNLPEELAVWLELDEAKKDDARELHDLVAHVLKLNETREQLELVTQDVVGQLERYMFERRDTGLGEFLVNLPPGSYVVDALSGGVVQDEVRSYVATGVHWAGQGGAEFYNATEGTKVQSKSLDFIIEPTVEPNTNPTDYSIDGQLSQ